MRISAASLLVALSGCAAPPAVAPERLPPAPLVFADPERGAKLARGFAEIDALVRAEVRDHQLAGMAFGVVVDGELVHFVGAGFADIEAKRPPDADTVFRIASMTKSFTALAILALRDDGALRLDDPLVRFIPEAARITPATRDSPPITIRQLLRHTSGLPGGGSFKLREGRSNEGAILDSLANVALETASETRSSYSNLGFQLLGVVAHRASGMGFHALMAKRLFKPLGMKSTSFMAEDIEQARLAVGYDRDDAGAEKIIPNVDFDGADSAGGIYTSVRDMARYIGLYLGAFPPRDDPDDGPIKRSSVREAILDALRVWPMTVHMRDAPPHGESLVTAGTARYGFGLGIHESCDFEDFVTHNGGLPGWGSSFGFLPQHGVGMVALTNQGRRGRDPTDLIQRAMLVLKRTGGLAPRVPARIVPPAIDTAMRRLLAVYNAWDSAAYVAMLSPARGPVTEEEERKELAGYHAIHGTCTAFGLVSTHGPRDAVLATACEHGVLEVNLSIDGKGLITSFWGDSRAVPAPPAIARAALGLTSLVNRWDDGVHDRLLGASGVPSTTRAASFEKIRAAHGSCLAGGYSRESGHHYFKLSCKRGGDMKLELALVKDDDERVGTFTFSEVPPGGRCPINVN